MRTSLELDDLIAAAKKMAREQGVTIGQAISQLARQPLTVNAPVKVRNGVPVFVPKPGASKPDLGIVNELREDD